MCSYYFIQHKVTCPSIWQTALTRIISFRKKMWNQDIQIPKQTSCCLTLVFPIAKLQSETPKDAARYLWDFSGNSADFCYLRVLSGKLWCSYMIFYLDDSWENVWVDGWTAMEGDLRTCLQADIRCRIWYPPSLAACQACHQRHHKKSFPYMDINTNFLLISTNFAGFWG